MQEPSLTKRVVVPAIAVLTATLMVILVYVRYASFASAEASAKTGAEDVISQYALLRQYYTEAVVAKAKEGGLRVSFDHRGKPGVVPLPASMIHDLSEQLSKRKSGIQLHLYSNYPFPNRAGRQLDNFQKQALAHFANGGQGTFSRQEETSQGRVLRVAVADRMSKQACVTCHNTDPASPKKDWALGEMRGVLEVRQPVEAQLAAIGGTVFKSLILGCVLMLAGGVLLAEYVRRKVSAPLVAMTHDLTERTRSGARAACELQSVGQQLAGEASLQAGSSEEVSATLEELTATIGSGAARSRDVLTRLTSAASAADASMRELTGMMSSMEAIESSARSIERIIRSINDISFQTNILALNAAVEAARAGEAGLGFAVVADEVRNLAKRSAEASAETAALIEAAIRSSEEGTARVGSVAKAVSQISPVFTELKAVLEELCASAQHQALGVQQINQAVGQMSLSTQETATGASTAAKLATKFTSDIQEQLRFSQVLQSKIEGN